MNVAGQTGPVDRRGPRASWESPGGDLGVVDAMPALWRGTHSVAGWHDPRTLPIGLDRWAVMLVGLDVAGATLAAWVAVLLKFGERPGSISGIPYALIAALLPPLWVVAMALTGSYGRRHVASGADQYLRVCNGAAWLLAAIAIGSFAVRVDVSRVLLTVMILLATADTLAVRAIVRRLLRRELARGRTIHRTLVVGSRPEVSSLIRHLRQAPGSGMCIVGACIPGDAEELDLPGGAVPVIASLDGAAEAARGMGADTVAIAGREALPGRDLRRFSWQLEGTGIDLVVAPPVVDVAGPRLRIRHIDGLPLLHVEEPILSGAPRLVKDALERALALAALLILAPVLALIALAIVLTSRGPALYRQVRIGRGGAEFTIWKFRTMRVGADALYAKLVEGTGHSGILFKLTDDPRITPVGRWLRRFSVDELPQLWNVLAGSMSLVGPRPQRADEVARYAPDDRRRLLVKPGMTGLWQVTGRNNLAWADTVRLDLYYVEHWSLWFDLVLLAKTVRAVITARGAY